MVERRHLHIVETGALIAQSHVPLNFLHLASDTATILINRLLLAVSQNKSHFGVKLIKFLTLIFYPPSFACAIPIP